MSLLVSASWPQGGNTSRKGLTAVLGLKQAGIESVYREFLFSRFLSFSLHPREAPGVSHA
jgi:hypothetical protein